MPQVTAICKMPGHPPKKKLSWTLVGAQLENCTIRDFALSQWDVRYQENAKKLLQMSMLGLQNQMICWYTGISEWLIQYLWKTFHKTGGVWVPLCTGQPCTSIQQLAILYFYFYLSINSLLVPQRVYWVSTKYFSYGIPRATSRGLWCRGCNFHNFEDNMLVRIYK